MTCLQHAIKIIFSFFLCDLSQFCSVFIFEGGISDCSLSLWRVVRGSKLMHLDSLIHGLFIT
jgi:hypothetical protein